MAKDSDLARKSNLETKYTKQNLYKDPFFGDFYIYMDNGNNSKIISTEKLLSDKEALRKDVEGIKKKILNKHDYILNLLDYSVEVQKNLCSTFYMLKCFYEYPNKSLKKEINERKMQGGQNNDFKKTDLTHFLYHQVTANAHLQDNNLNHGDIYPGSIFLTDKEDYKLAFRLNQKFSNEKLQMERIMRNEPLYQSPAIYTALKKRNFSNIIHNKTKSDVFSLGLCMLEAGLLRSIQSIYNKGDEIDEHMLNIYMDEFEMKYEDNPLLFSSVRKMCEMDESERPTFTDLKMALPDYAEICDYFYKVEHGLINEEEEEGWDEQGQDPNFDSGYYQNDPYTQFNNNQGFDVMGQTNVQSIPNEQPYGQQLNRQDSYPNQYQDYNSNQNEMVKQNQNYGYQNNNMSQAKPGQYQPQNAYDSEPYYPETDVIQNKQDFQPLHKERVVNSNPQPIIAQEPEPEFDKYAEMDFFGDVTPDPIPQPKTQPQYQSNQMNYQIEQRQPVNVNAYQPPQYNSYQYSTPNVQAYPQSNTQVPSYSNTNVQRYSNSNIPVYNKRPESQQTYGNNTTMYSNTQTQQNQYYQPPQNQYYRNY